MDGSLLPQSDLAPTDPYDRDAVAWARGQILVLRAGDLARLDRRHVAEALDDMVWKRLSDSRTWVRLVIEHLLKLEVSPAVAPRAGWIDTVLEYRQRAADEVRDSETVRAELDLDRCFRAARAKAAKSLAVHGEAEAARALPKDCPYTLDQVLDPDFFPANCHGLA